MTWLQRHPPPPPMTFMLITLVTTAVDADAVPAMPCSLAHGARCAVQVVAVNGAVHLGQLQVGSWPPPLAHPAAATRSALHACSPNR